MAGRKKGSAKGLLKGKQKNRNLRPVDMDQRLEDNDYAGYYKLADGTIIEAHEYLGFDEDEDFMDSYENDTDPGTRLIGGVYYTDIYGDGGVMGYVEGDTVRTFNESGFLPAPIVGIIAKDGEPAYAEIEQVFDDYDMDDNERMAAVTAIGKRHGLLNRRPKAAGNLKVKGRTGEMIAELVGAMGYELEAVRMVGEDPEMHFVEYVVLGRMPDSRFADAQFAVWQAIDWSNHPDRKQRNWGVSLSDGRYTVPNGKAMDEFEAVYAKQLGSYTWLVPGSREKVPGCYGYGR